MPHCDRWRIRAMLVAIAVAALLVVVAAAQARPEMFSGGNALQGIPAPEPITIRPRLFAAYGAITAAVMLIVLYLYRGRAFIVYWIGSWLLFAASLALLARGYQDVRLGSVMVGLAQLLGVWAAGLALLAGNAFPDAPLRWNTPLKIAAATAVWFLAGPFVFPLTAVTSSGPAAKAILLGWASIRYLNLMRRTRYVGAFLIGAGMVLMAASNAAAAGLVLSVGEGTPGIDRLLAANIVMTLFVALGMHVLVFEDMTDELRRAHRGLEDAHEEVKRLAITDPLTGCHNRRFFDEIERREMQRFHRYGAPISVVFVDVNHFKHLNDTLGHEAGDRILKMLGTLLRKHVRESDYVIRWGGDEFLLLLTCGAEDAQRKADDLRRAFERELSAAHLPERVGLSVGVSPVSKEAPTLEEAIRAADSRMYHDKLVHASRAGGAIR